MGTLASAFGVGFGGSGNGAMADMGSGFLGWLVCCRSDADLERFCKGCNWFRLCSLEISRVD